MNKPFNLDIQVNSAELQSHNNAGLFDPKTF